MSVTLRRMCPNCHAARADLRFGQCSASSAAVGLRRWLQAMSTLRRQWLQQWAIDGAELVCAVELNQFMIRFGGAQGADAGDRLTLATVAQIQADAIAFIGASQWRGRWVMRVSVCSIATTSEDGRLTVEAVRDAWHKVRERL